MMNGVRLTLVLTVGLAVAGMACGGSRVPPAAPAAPLQAQVAVRKSATPPPPTQTAVVIPGEDSVVPVAALPAARWPQDAPNARVDLHFETLNARSATDLADALKPLDGIGAMAPDEKERLRALFYRAKRLAGLAQAPFSAEPSDRQGRLRAVALHAALDAYKEVLLGMGERWGSREGCWLTDCAEKLKATQDVTQNQTRDGRCSTAECAEKGWFLLVEALLYEQAGDLINASAAYNQVLADTVATLAGTRRRWVEGSQTEGVCHVGLAMLAEAASDPSQHATVVNEFSLALDSLNCAGMTTGVACAPLRAFVIDHIKTTNPPMLAELDRVQQERARKRQAEAALVELWRPVQQQGDQVAQLMWMVEYEQSKLSQMQPIQRDVVSKQIAGSRRRIAAMIQQGVCPAKKAFLAKAGAAEFAQRSAAHCKDSPPTGSAQGRYYAGAETGEVTLTKQCQASLASSCP